MAKRVNVALFVEAKDVPALITHLESFKGYVKPYEMQNMRNEKIDEPAQPGHHSKAA
jgi:hypothetical protein